MLRVTYILNWFCFISTLFVNGYWKSFLVSYLKFDVSWSWIHLYQISSRVKKKYTRFSSEMTVRITIGLLPLQDTYCWHPSITDGVHRNENFVKIIPVFSTFSKFFKKKIYIWKPFYVIFNAVAKIYFLKI